VARTLVEAGYMVLSGLARGIDRAAHEATLDAGGRTVAVMGTGIDRMYPAEHKQLAERIVASGGALISQFEPGASGARHTFPMRNATMSGLALATVVVEAGETSGAKVQALAGLKHGSGVFLLRSLYETQEWARELVDVGKYGMRAHLIDDDRQLMAALRSPHVEQEQLAFS
ncbi:MAG: DNA-processing protein DprA, partial [Thermoleophilia bacterium]|nr:DNA-processing protein DprA [Thermoleophilia bacterium]